jgi:ligand-binding sensor domain-containing protein
VYQVVQDNSGNLWFATNSGVTKYDGKKWYTYVESDGAPTYYIRKLTVDKLTNNIWCISNGNGPYVFHDNKWQKHQFTGFTTPYYYIQDILFDSKNNIWLYSNQYTQKGIWQFDGISWKRNSSENGLFTDQVNVIFEDSKQNIWFGANNGISVYNGSTFKHYQGIMNNGLLNIRVMDIDEDSFGNIWVGCYDSDEGGVAKFDGFNWEGYSQNFHSLFVNALLIDSEGILWIGSSAYSSSNISITTLNKSILGYHNLNKNGLTTNCINDIFEDKSKNIWLCTDKGVYMAKLANVDIQLPDALSDFEKAISYPNPFSEKTTIEYQLKNQSDVSLEVFDIMGKLVRNYTFNKQIPGNHKILIDGAGLNTGSYFYTLRSGKSSFSGKISFIKI